MSALNDAADVLRRHTKGLEALQAAAAYLDGFASLDNLEREVKGRIDALQSQAAEIEGRIAVLKDQEVSIALAREQDRIEHQRIMQDLKNETQAAADAAAAETVEHSKKALAEAKEQADAIVRNAEQSTSTSREKAERAMADANKAAVARDAAAAELKDLEAKIAEARTKIAQMLQQ